MDKGILRRITRKLRITPQFSQTDMTGVIHNAEYFLWFEEGRMQIMRELISVEESLAQGVIPLVVRNSCRYRRPVRLGDELVLITAHGIVETYAGRLVFEHSLVDEKDKAETASGECHVTLFDMRKNQLVKTWPPHVWERYRNLR